MRKSYSLELPVDSGQMAILLLPADLPEALCRKDSECLTPAECRQEPLRVQCPVRPGQSIYLQTQHKNRHHGVAEAFFLAVSMHDECDGSTPPVEEGQVVVLGDPCYTLQRGVYLQMINSRHAMGDTYKFDSQRAVSDGAAQAEVAAQTETPPCDLPFVALVSSTGDGDGIYKAEIMTDAEGFFISAKVSFYDDDDDDDEDAWWDDDDDEDNEDEDNKDDGKDDDDDEITVRDEDDNGEAHP